MMNKKIIFKISSRLQLILVKHKTKIQILKLILDKIVKKIFLKITKFKIKLSHLVQILIVHFQIIAYQKHKKSRNKYLVNKINKNKQNLMLLQL